MFGMGFAGFILYIIIFILCFMFVGKLIKTLPRDINTIRMFKAEGKMDFYYGELFALIGSWIVALLIIVFMLWPVVVRAFHAAGDFAALILGFRM